MIPSSGGCFELSVNGDLIYSKLQTGEFPDEGELVKEVLPDGGNVMIFVGRLAQLNARQRRAGASSGRAASARSRRRLPT
jgi:hypothetical protein